MTRLRNQKTAIVSFSVLLAATIGGATAKPLVAAWIVNPVLPQMLSASTFPLPSSVPVGTTIRIGGSSSMATINQVLKRRFEQQYVGTDVVLNTQGTGPAIKDVLDGNADLAAIGRSLTEQEKAQGLIPVPVSRHKIAIIVGSQNPFKGDLTFEQFAKLFRGEIKDWSQLGGVHGPIRFIDRPDSSDTRQAFRNYPVFKQAPFVTGKTARQMAQDSTSQVIQALGTDGIGYAIADQLEGRGDVRVLTMHKTLPSNPKYPFSQPLIYVYKGPQPNPSAQAFLGFASAPASRKTIETARKESTALLNANPDVTSPTPEPKISITTSPAVTPSATKAPQTVPPTATDTALTHPLPWWLWLLALPLLGVLFWWLLKDRERQLALEEPPAESMEPELPLEEVIDPLPEIEPPLLEMARSTGSRITLVPRECTDAYAYWEIPDDEKESLQQQGARKLVLRLYDVTGVNLQQQPPISLQEFDCDATAQDRHLPIRTADRDYLAELGYIAEDGRWLQVARSEVVHVPACPPPPIDTDAETPVSEPSPAPGDDAEKIGGAPLADRSVAEDRSVAGSGTADGIPDHGVADRGTAGGGVTKDAAPEGDSGTRAMLAGDRSSLPLNADENRIILVPGIHTEVYAYWDITAEAKESLQQQGGQTLALRLYDVTDAVKQEPSSLPFQQFDTNESATSQALPIPTLNHQYAAELGYLTHDDRWLKLARSLPVQVSSPQMAPALVTDASQATNQAVPLQTGQSRRENGVGTTSFFHEALNPSDDYASAESQSASQSQIVLVPRNSHSAYIHWAVAQADKDALKHQGGQQLVLRVYDVMGTEAISNHHVQQFVCNEWEHDQQVPIPISNADYVAELGYTTLDGRFLTLARSTSTRVPGA